jgi:hypothetical protein
MEPAQDARLSELRDRQQAGFLIEDERLELQALMPIYQAGKGSKSFRQSVTKLELSHKGFSHLPTHPSTHPPIPQVGKSEIAR